MAALLTTHLTFQEIYNSSLKSSNGSVITFHKESEDVTFKNLTGHNIIRFSNDGLSFRLINNHNFTKLPVRHVSLTVDQGETYLMLNYKTSTGEIKHFVVKNISCNFQGHDTGFNLYSEDNKEQFCLGKNGCVGIGINAPTESLHVLGNVAVKDSKSATTLKPDSLISNSQLYIGSDGENRIQINGRGDVLPINDNYLNLGSTFHRFSDVYSVNGGISTSDRKLKTNIEPSDLGLEFICALEAVKYKWKQNGHRYHYGLIAQDLENALNGKDFAGLVKNTDEDSINYGLRYNELISPMISAIQQLHTKIARLEKYLI